MSHVFSTSVAGRVFLRLGKSCLWLFRDCHLIVDIVSACAKFGGPSSHHNHGAVFRLGAAQGDRPPSHSTSSRAPHHRWLPCSATACPVDVRAQIKARLFIQPPEPELGSLPQQQVSGQTLDPHPRRPLEPRPLRADLLRRELDVRAILCREVEADRCSAELPDVAPLQLLVSGSLLPVHRLALRAFTEAEPLQNDRQVLRVRPVPFLVFLSCAVSLSLGPSELQGSYGGRGVFDFFVRKGFGALFRFPWADCSARQVTSRRSQGIRSTRGCAAPSSTQ